MSIILGDESFLRVYDMMRDGQKAATVITLSNGKCIVCWPTSVIVYDSEEAARAVHIAHMGGRGEPTKFEPVPWSEGWEHRRNGMVCAAMDANENCPFGSVGGIEKRGALELPQFLKDELDQAGVGCAEKLGPWKAAKDKARAWMMGYIEQCFIMYGPDWQTVGFSWSHAFTIENGEVKPPEEKKP